MWMWKFWAENHQQSPASITRFFFLKSGRARELGREREIRRRWRKGTGRGECWGGVDTALQILIIYEILEIRAYQVEINHWGLLSRRMAPRWDKREASVWGWGEWWCSQSHPEMSEHSSAEKDDIRHLRTLVLPIIISYFESVRSQTSSHSSSI